jgi:hypothetical protein
VSSVNLSDWFANFKAKIVRRKWQNLRQNVPSRLTP